MRNAKLYRRQYYRSLEADGQRRRDGNPDNNQQHMNMWRSQVLS